MLRNERCPACRSDHGEESVDGLLYLLVEFFEMGAFSGILS